MSRDSWTTEERNICWSVLACSRNELQLSLSSVIAPAFVILQRYHAKEKLFKKDTYFYIIAAVLIATKQIKIDKSIEQIASSIQNTLHIFKTKCTKSCPIHFLGKISNEDYKLTDEDKQTIAEIETELLRAIEWENPINHPFRYINLLLGTDLNISLKNLNNSSLESRAIICGSLLTKSKEYMDIPIEVAAAASLYIAAQANETTEVINQYIEKKRNEHRDEFELALKVIERDQCSCLPVVKRILKEPD